VISVELRHGPGVRRAGRATAEPGADAGPAAALAPPLDGAWIDPAAGRVRFGVYASDWIRDRVLKPRTAELYRGLLANHLEQSFGNLNVSSIREPNVRRWRKERLDSGRDASPPFGR
jgi:hypothetical protein